MFKKDSILKRRLFLFIIIVCLVFLYIIANYFKIQVLNNDFYRSKALDKVIKEIPIQPKRGSILDSNGKKLAYSVTKFNIWIDKRDFKSDHKEKIIKILGITEEEFDSKMNGERNIIKIASLVDSSTAKIVDSYKYAGIWATKDSKRIYPYDDFASQIIGHTTIDNVGINGIEYAFEEKLKGSEGKLVIYTDAVGRELPYGKNERIDPVEGENIYLTIDEVIQFFTQKNLQIALEKNKAKRVMAIVMEVKTGKILAMDNRPGYNLNSPRTKPIGMDEEEYNDLEDKQKVEIWSNIWKNPLVSEVYEPGSIFKVITAAAGLEEGKVDLFSQFNEDDGFINVYGSKIKCWTYPDNHGKETFVEAMENSCNPVFVKVGQRITSSRFYDYLVNLGLTEKPQVNLPGVGSSLIPSREDVGPVELATMSFGHGISVSPLQLITAVSGLVNDGNLMQPQIIEKIENENNETVHEFKKEFQKQVISKETSRDLRLILESVVNNGSGKNAYIPGIRVGGKTGTSEKLIGGEYSSEKVYSSFFGFAPVDDPEIAILVIVDEPQDEHYGSIVAAPIAKEILESTLKYRGIKPDFTE